MAEIRGVWSGVDLETGVRSWGGLGGFVLCCVPCAFVF